MNQLIEFNTGRTRAAGIMFLPVTTAQVAGKGKGKTSFSTSRGTKKHESVGKAVFLYQIQQSGLNLFLSDDVLELHV